MKQVAKRITAVLLCVAVLMTSTDFSLITSFAEEDVTGELKKSGIVIDDGSEELFSTYDANDVSGGDADVSGGDYLDFIGGESEVFTENAVASVSKDKWTERGLLPYENYVYGESCMTGNWEFDREAVTFYDLIKSIDNLELFNEEDAEKIRTYKSAINGELGAVAENTKFVFLEDLDEIIACAEDGMDLNIFFYGTTLTGISLDELYSIKEQGLSLEDYKVIVEDESEESSGTYDGEEQGDIVEINYDDVSGNNTITEIKALNTTKSFNTVTPVKTSLKEASINAIGDTATVELTQYTEGELGDAFGKKHGKLWYIKVGGAEAFCSKYGGSLSRTNTVKEVAKNVEGDEAALKAAIQWYINSAGFNGTDEDEKKQSWVLTQYLIWYIIEKGVPTPDADTIQEFTKACVNTQTNTTPSEASQCLVNFYRYYKYYKNGDDSEVNLDTIADYIIIHYWENLTGGNSQSLITY